MKRLALLITALLLLAMLAVACGGGTTETPVEEAAPTEEAAVVEEATEAPAEEEAAAEGDCSAEDVLCVGLVTDVGRIDDKSFNQSAWEGAQQAAEVLGAAEVNYVETTNATDYAANIDLFAGQGYDIIVTVGFAMGEATAAAAATYPDIDFIGVDQFQGDTIANLTGLVFNEDKAGYLAGVLAASLSESGTIASVLGTDLVPPVVAFNEGYQNGAMSVNPDINIIATYHPGGLDVAFTDPEWGATTAQQAIDQGADIIFGAGGQTGNGALIQAAGVEGVWCIGVDTDQWDTVPEAQPCLVSSAMKLITPGVVDLATASVNGEFPGGNFFGAVGLAPFHAHEDAVPQDVKDLLDTTSAGLLDGSITTGYGEG
ncbi:MAG: BMP family ABC transporter substrate-binding protein [Candidatus Promineofilum sp.]|nr:BMP family ABC transporter substrate-binding protein [Promineifilum sp.]